LAADVTATASVLGTAHARRWHMLKRALWGAAAGAAGTAVLNLITYVDMLVRARPASSVPADTADRLANRAGIQLEADDAESTQNRRTAAGALLGFGAGIGLGAAYGVVEKAIPDMPAPISGAFVGLAAMAASDVPATVIGATDPLTWDAAGWLADLAPHYGYGLATVLVYRALR
jgi:hypothetical protein